MAEGDENTMHLLSTPLSTSLMSSLLAPRSGSRGSVAPTIRRVLSPLNCRVDDEPDGLLHARAHTHTHATIPIPPCHHESGPEQNTLHPIRTQSHLARAPLPP